MTNMSTNSMISHYDGEMAKDARSVKWAPNALTSFETLVAGGDPFKETLLRRCNANYDKILADVIKEMLMQKIASLHYEAINNYVLFAPTMVITLLSAIISIFGTSQVITDADMKIWLSITVACLQLVLSVFQSLSKQLNYGARAGFHRSASATLKKMWQNARHGRIENRMQSMRKALIEDPDLTDGFDLGNDRRFHSDNDSKSSKHSSKKEKKKKKGVAADKKGADGTPPVENDGEQSDEEEEHKKPKQQVQRETTDSLTRQFKQAVDQVDSFVPVRVANAFNVMETRVKCINESLLTSKKHTLVAWEKVLIALYFQLAETIIEWRGFPFVIPGPRAAVDKTLRNFKEHIRVDQKDNPADLLDDIIARSEKVAKTQVAVVEDRMRRSFRHAGYYLQPTPKIVNAVTRAHEEAHEEEDNHTQEIHFFQDPTNDLESNNTNYGSMDEKTSLV